MNRAFKDDEPFPSIRVADIERALVRAMEEGDFEGADVLLDVLRAIEDARILN